MLSASSATPALPECHCSPKERGRSEAILSPPARRIDYRPRLRPRHIGLPRRAHATGAIGDAAASTGSRRDAGATCPAADPAPLHSSTPPPPPVVATPPPPPIPPPPVVEKPQPKPPPPERKVVVKRPPPPREQV